MQLLPDELRRALPPLYSQEYVTNPIAPAKFFAPDSSWTWLVTEGSPEADEFLFFGYVIGQEEEWGYFALLEAVQGPLRLPIERDLYFRPGPFSQVLARLRGERSG